MMAKRCIGNIATENHEWRWTANINDLVVDDITFTGIRIANT